MGNCRVSDNTPSQVCLSPFNCFVLVPCKHVEGQVKNLLLVLAVNRGLGWLKEAEVIITNGKVIDFHYNNVKQQHQKKCGCKPVWTQRDLRLSLTSDPIRTARRCSAGCFREEWTCLTSCSLPLMPWLGWSWEWLPPQCVVCVAAECNSLSGSVWECSGSAAWTYSG